MKELSKLEWALFYSTKLRLFIFPMVAKSKNFIGGLSWPAESTIDEEKIRGWWKQDPDYNIAMDCFKSKKVVFDVDMKGGKDGLRSAVELLGDQILLLETKQARTPTGGFHFHYDYEYDTTLPDVRNSAGDLGVGLDIRANGGCCMLPGSEVEGFNDPYRWELNNPDTGKTMPCLPFPDILRLAPKGKGEATYLNASRGLSGDSPGGRTKIQDGGRDDYLISVAGLYRRGGASAEEIHAALVIRNAEWCNPPKDDKDLWRIANSAERWEPAAWSVPTKVAEIPRVLVGGGEVLDDDGFITQCELEIPWMIEGFVQKGGLLLLSAAPKAGKSSIARNMLKAVATGTPFLNRRTVKGKALWIGVAEPKVVLRHAQEAMDLLGLGILWVTSRPPGAWQTWLASVVEQHQPDFVVVDEIGRLATDLESVNDYSQVTRATQPFLDLRTRYGSTFVLVHHDKKSGGTLGSAAWDGAVDCIMSVKRFPDGTRTLQTMQRLGEDLEPSILARDKETGRISIPGTKASEDQRRAEQAILSALQLGRKMTRHELTKIPGGGVTVGRDSVDALLSEGKIEATGSGRKGDPRLYQAATIGSHVGTVGIAPGEALTLTDSCGIYKRSKYTYAPQVPHEFAEASGDGPKQGTAPSPHADRMDTATIGMVPHATAPTETPGSDVFGDIGDGLKDEKRFFAGDTASDAGNRTSPDDTEGNRTQPQDTEGDRTQPHDTAPNRTHANGTTSGLVVEPPVPPVLEYALDVLGGYEEPDELPYPGES